MTSRLPTDGAACAMASKKLTCRSSQRHLAQRCTSACRCRVKPGMTKRKCKQDESCPAVQPGTTHDKKQYDESRYELIGAASRSLKGSNAARQARPQGAQNEPEIIRVQRVRRTPAPSARRTSAGQVRHFQRNRPLKTTSPLSRRYAPHKRRQRLRCRLREGGRRGRESQHPLPQLV